MLFPSASFSSSEESNDKSDDESNDKLHRKSDGRNYDSAAASPSSPGTRFSSLLLCCFVAHTLHRVRCTLNGICFIRKPHISEYNTFQRIREQNSCPFFIFRELTKLGIECRISGHFSARTTGLRAELIHSTTPFDPACPEKWASQRPIFRIYNHIPESVRGQKSRNTVVSISCEAQSYSSIYVCFLDDTVSVPFSNHDPYPETSPPTTKREARGHPLFFVPSGHPREVVFPKRPCPLSDPCGSSVCNSTKWFRKGVATGKKKLLQAYPVTHRHRLLTEREAWSLGFCVPLGTVPYRKWAKKKGAETISLFAPWQLQKRNLPPDTILTPRDIPEGHVYIMESLYAGMSVDSASVYVDILSRSFGPLVCVRPHIGQVYDTRTGRMVGVRGGLLLPTIEYEKRKEWFKAHLLLVSVKRVCEANHSLILNLQILYVRSRQWFEVLEELEKG